MWEAYLKYLDFIVHHFKDRVASWGLGADWPYSKERYDTISAIIKTHAPDAKLMGVSNAPSYDHFDETRGQFFCANRHDAGYGIEALPDVFAQMKAKIKRYREDEYEGHFECGLMMWSLYPPGPRANGGADHEVMNDSEGYNDHMYY